ncbi:MAG: hypothetical protein LBM00_05890 [Deltaproteobacteria bacterium]|jgi:hypothetical protein|nr:hypothetical protein [Deltaproteobacteria bacterium]
MTELFAKYGDSRLRRDLLRDFCLTAHCLEEQFARFDASGSLSFTIIAETIGNDCNKGLLWHIKDSSGLLFKNKTLSAAAGQLDWTIGYLFHECLQVMEAAYQLRHYGPKLAVLCRLHSTGAGKVSGIEQSLHEMAEQSGANLGHHIARARALISAATGLFCRYLAGESANRPLARFIHDREKLLRDVFGVRFETLLQSIYGQNTELVFLESALSLAELGRRDKAALALRKALEINPHNAECARLLESMLVTP